MTHIFGSHKERITNQVRDQVWHQIHNQASYGVKIQIRDLVVNPILNQVWEQIWNKVCYPNITKY